MILFLLISLIGGSYAFFSVIFKDTRTNVDDNTHFTTGDLSQNTLISDIPDTAGSFIESDIYPGHKEFVGLNVTTNGSIGSHTYLEFIYTVKENGLNDNIKVSLFESSVPIEVTDNYFECFKKTETKTEETIYYESCLEKKTGTLIEETILKGGEEIVSLGKDEIILDSESVTKYYYVVIEFLNKEESQNEVMNQVLNGHIDVQLIPYYHKLTFCEKYPKNPTCNIESLIKEGTLAYDGTTDNNLRYIGANPNNYVTFNNELWRIIGWMNHVDDGSQASSLKIIRGSSIGNYPKSTIGTGYGDQNWNTSSLREILNTTYKYNLFKRINNRSPRYDNEY